MAHEGQNGQGGWVRREGERKGNEKVGESRREERKLSGDGIRPGEGRDQGTRVE